MHDLQIREPGCGLVEPGERLVGGGVVVGNQLIGVPAGIHGLTDPRHLGGDVTLLVVAREDDRDIRSALGRKTHGS
jgi:hypothetical protein